VILRAALLLFVGIVSVLPAEPEYHQLKLMEITEIRLDNDAGIFLNLQKACTAAIL
jgi:hypothetical protein